MAPQSRLFLPGSVGPAGPSGPAGPAGPPGPPGANLHLLNHGADLGPITTLDVEGVGANSSVTGTTGTINTPPFIPPTPAWGYWSGGSAGVIGSNVTDRLDFLNDTAAMITRGALIGHGNCTGLNSSTKGYFSTAALSTPSFAAGSVASLVFATDSTPMVFTNSDSLGLIESGAVNSLSLGYWSGGFTGGGAATTNSTSLVFASDSNPMVAKGALTTARGQLAGCNSSTFGYFAGGYQPSGLITYNLCDKLNFSSDSSAMVAAGAMTINSWGLAGANSGTFGYFSGGDTSIASPTLNITAVTSALNFASDSTAMVAKGNLTIATLLLAGANSTLVAYFAGGETSLSAGEVSTNNALTFATDSVAMVTKGALSTPRATLGACQSSGIL